MVETEEARVNAVRFESILNIIPPRADTLHERIRFDRLGRFAEVAIMFFRDTRLCVSARAARQPSTSPWVKSEVTGSVFKGRGNILANISVRSSPNEKFKGKIDRILLLRRI